MSTKLISPKTGREIIDPKTDFAFKKLFASDNPRSKKMLLSIINAFTSKDHRMTVIKEINVINPYNLGEYAEDKESLLDIKAMDENGLAYNVEMQAGSDPEYFKRALFYWAKIYTSQIKKGDPYNKLNRTIGIHFLDFNCIDYLRSRYHNIFAIKHRRNSKIKLYGIDLLEIHLIELRKLNKDYDNIDSAFEWASFFADVVSCIKNEDQIKTIEVREALEDLDKLKLTEQEKEAYKTSLKRAFDQNPLLYRAKMEGMKKGVEEGREEGAKDIAIKLKMQGMSVAQISTITGLSIKEIQDL